MKLTLTTDEEDGYTAFTVERVGLDAYDGRPVWRWTIEAYEDGSTWKGEDLRGAETAGRALGDLLSFASACADSENRDLFPRACAELLAFIGSDHLALYGEEVEGVTA